MKTMKTVLAVICILVVIFYGGLCINHSKDGFVGAIVHSWNDVCDGIASVFGLKSSSADVYFNFTNRHIKWDNVNISW